MTSLFAKDYGISLSVRGFLYVPFKIFCLIPVQSWKLSRTTSLSADAVAAIYAVTSNVTVLNDRYYQTVSHSDDACFYLPPPGGVGPTIFRGQCDDNIPVVSNFDAVEVCILNYLIYQF